MKYQNEKYITVKCAVDSGNLVLVEMISGYASEISSRLYTGNEICGYSGFVIYSSFNMGICQVDGASGNDFGGWKTAVEKGI